MSTYDKTTMLADITLEDMLAIPLNSARVFQSCSIWRVPGGWIMRGMDSSVFVPEPPREDQGGRKDIG